MVPFKNEHFMQTKHVFPRGTWNVPQLEPIFHLATLFARREAKTRIWQRDWLKLAGEKIHREQLGRVPILRANKFAKWKIALS